MSFVWCARVIHSLWRHLGCIQFVLSVIMIMIWILGSVLHHIISLNFYIEFPATHSLFLCVASLACLCFAVWRHSSKSYQNLRYMLLLCSGYLWSFAHNPSLCLQDSMVAGIAYTAPHFFWPKNITLVKKNEQPQFFLIKKKNICWQFFNKNFT